MRQYPPGKPPIVEVEWYDACSNHGWYDTNTLKKLELVVMWTVGYMLRRNRRVIVLAQAVSDYAKYSELWIVPMATVKRVRRLK